MTHHHPGCFHTTLIFLIFFFLFLITFSGGKFLLSELWFSVSGRLVLDNLLVSVVITMYVQMKTAVIVEG